MWDLHLCIVLLFLRTWGEVVAIEGEMDPVSDASSVPHSQTRSQRVAGASNRLHAVTAPPPWPIKTKPKRVGAGPGAGPANWRPPQAKKNMNKARVEAEALDRLHDVSEAPPRYRTRAESAVEVGATDALDVSTPPPQTPKARPQRVSDELIQKH